MIGALDFRFVLLGYLVDILALTIFAAVSLRRPYLLLLAPVFPFMRFVDAYIFLRSIPPSSRRTHSNGSWMSPARRKRPISKITIWRHLWTTSFTTRPDIT